MDKTPLILLAVFLLFFAATSLDFFNLSDPSPLRPQFGADDRLGPSLKKHLNTRQGLNPVKGGLAVKNQASLHLNFNQSQRVILYFVGRPNSSQNAEFELKVGEEVVDRRTISSFEQYASPALNLSGQTTLKLVGQLFLSRIKLIEEPEYKDRFIFADNWYPPEYFYNPSRPDYDFVWMSENASLYYYNSRRPRRVRARLVIRSFHRPRHLLLDINQKRHQVIEVNNTLDKGRETYITQPFLLESGANRIEFNVKEGCLVASQVEGNTDQRCLSLVFDHFSLKSY